MMMNETDSMTAERFEALLEAYGAEMARWPMAERLAAHAYVETAPEAVRLLAEARSLDVLLAAPAMPQPPLGLEESILAQVARIAGSTGRATLAGLIEALWPRASLWKPASVFASALALGALIGINLFGALAPADPDTAREDVLAYAVPDLTQDLN